MKNIKTNRSWSKPEIISDLIGRKKVDWSIFEYGSHIPLNFHDDFEKANNNIHIDLGENRDIKLIINNMSYDARLVNVNRKSVNIDTLQLRYDSNEELKKLLMDKFENSYIYLKEKKNSLTEEDKRKQVTVPDEIAEYMEFYDTGEPFVYRVELITQNINLAEPFSNIFKDKLEADWAFGLLTTTCNKLDIDDINDQRFSITLRNNNTRIHFNFCDWMILGFFREYENLILNISLISNDLPDELELAFNFKNSNINSYYLPLSSVEYFEENYQTLYFKTLDQIKERFKNWSKSQYRRYNVKELAQGIFSFDERNKMLTEGLKENNYLATTNNNVWWVNQGQTLKEEKEAGILWAPIETENGRSMYHWDTMKEVQEGDIVLHYASGALRYVSQVISPAVKEQKPEELADSDWNRDGRLVKTDYYQLEPEITLDKFNHQVKNLNIDKGPINKNGAVNQGYLFNFNKEALSIIQQSQPETEWPDFALINDNGIVEIDVKKSINHINEYISQKGFSYPFGLVENFYLSLKTKPFALLAGISGTGKTKLTRIFAEAINCKYKLISVRPDWSDSSDLLGYKNIQGKFQPGPMIDTIKEAEENPDDIYFVCLDEMNLARVEYYFSDFLSIMETRNKSGDKITTDELMTEKDFEQEEDKKYAGLIIPDNLYVIGTVNMDETTHPFSKKVLDRANTIEFSEINLSDYKLNDDQTEEPGNTITVKNDFLQAEFITLNDCSQEYEKTIIDTINRLEEINEILKDASLQIGYRVRDEICFYMIYNNRENLIKSNIAFDFQLMQKVLPRIQGSSEAIKKVLIGLFKVATGRNLASEDGVIGDKALDYAKANKTNLFYPESAEKIAYMIKRFEEDGFTAYWL